MTVGDIVNGVVRINLAGGIAILGVIALRKLVRPQFGARLAYRLWLLPVLAGAAVLVPLHHAVLAARTATMPPAVFDLAAPSLPPSASASFNLDPLLLLVLWLFGVAVAALAMAHLQDCFEAEAKDGLVGPAVIGVISPRIITPQDFHETFNDEEQALVLAHEQAHIARQDSRLNGVSAALQCLFWFNPLVHLAAHLMRIDQEMACDETVISRFPAACGAYARALVKAQLSLRPLPLGCRWPSGRDHPLLERVGMLRRDSVSPGRRLAGAGAMALLCTVASVAAWASQPPQFKIIASPPAPPLWSTQSPDSDAAPTRNVAGAITAVSLTKMSTDIGVRDNLTRQILWVHTDDAQTLARAARQPLAETLKAGVQIAVHGYGAPGRPGIFADAKQITFADGSPMFPSISAQLTEQARLSACGPMPPAVYSKLTTDAAKSSAIYAWQAACDVKAANGLDPPDRRGPARPA
jgi:beta-lactamase regulating signal transducer with metallopeptidase domain